MSKITSAIYKTGIGIYKILPFKRLVCFGIKKIKIPNTLFYRDLKFNGKFKVELSPTETFYLFHSGGTIENETFWKGPFVSWENDTGWIWEQLCKCSETIFDIGANTGIYSMVAKALNPTSKVYAFEPSTHIFSKLVLNNKLNNFDIKCEQVALSNLNGEQVFYDTPYASETSASLSPEKLKDWKGYKGEICEYKVNTLTMASYIESNKIDRLDLIKMDIEMHEPKAIAGLGIYLLKFKPIVIIEVLSEKVANELNELIDVNDFFIYHLKDKGVAERKAKFYAIPEKWNYIFFHKDLEAKMKQYTTLSI